LKQTKRRTVFSFISAQHTFMCKNTGILRRHHLPFKIDILAIAMRNAN